MARGRLASRAARRLILLLGRSPRSSISSSSVTRLEPQSRMRARVSMRTVKPRLAGSACCTHSRSACVRGLPGNWLICRK
ncbi:MAG: hypothetical protein EBZ76_13390 [Synechococcaceae bacterium WB9_2_170]|nr:hypothetical protein [Synechococcaceae bacterium WB9_2_170]